MLAIGPRPLPEDPVWGVYDRSVSGICAEVLMRSGMPLRGTVEGACAAPTWLCDYVLWSTASGAHERQRANQLRVVAARHGDAAVLALRAVYALGGVVAVAALAASLASGEG